MLSEWIWELRRYSSDMNLGRMCDQAHVCSWSGVLISDYKALLF